MPTFFIIVILWLSIFSLVYFVSPDTSGAIVLLFVLTFLALLFTFATLFINTRRGLLIALSLTLFIVLRYFGIGSLLNLFLILGIAGSIEFYLMKNS